MISWKLVILISLYYVAEFIPVASGVGGGINSGLQQSSYNMLIDKILFPIVIIKDMFTSGSILVLIKSVNDNKNSPCAPPLGRWVQWWHSCCVWCIPPSHWAPPASLPSISGRSVDRIQSQRAHSTGAASAQTDSPAPLGAHLHRHSRMSTDEFIFLKL